jgi:hypothetical protein
MMFIFRTLLNQTSVKYGTYTAESNNIRRSFTWGFSYISTVCNSEAEATRIVDQLNRLYK